MCQLGTEMNEVESQKGYKVVAMKDGKYYSLAMGFCYNDHELMPKALIQNRLTAHFNDSILNIYAGWGYREHMVGRTAIFLRYENAHYLAELLKYTMFDPAYDIAIVEATVSVDLMGGFYESQRVVAGRRIEFGKVKKVIAST